MDIIMILCPAPFPANIARSGCRGWNPSTPNEYYDMAPVIERAMSLYFMK